MLIDEADTFIKANEDLRGILNAGHTREAAFVIRSIGEDHDPRRFSTWAPKAIALIGTLHPTLADRSIRVRLRRKLPTESVSKLRNLDPDQVKEIQQRLVRFTKDHGEAFEAATPVIPDELHDRAADNWEPLLAIADLAGSHWGTTARKAAVELSSVDLDDEVLAVQLLRDIREVFTIKGLDRIHSVNLVEALTNLDDRPWSDLGNGRVLTPPRLARLLKQFEIKSKQIRIDEINRHGYVLDTFDEAFARYLDSPTV